MRASAIFPARETAAGNMILSRKVSIVKRILSLAVLLLAGIFAVALQQFRVVTAETVRWTFGSRSGSAVADADGLITIPHLTVTGVPAILRLEK